jgi:hypothetical protein
MIDRVFTRAEARYIPNGSQSTTDMAHPTRTGDVIVFAYSPYQYDGATPGTLVSLSHFFGLNGVSPVCDVNIHSGRFPQVSGLVLNYDCNGPTPVITGMWLAPEGPGGTLTPIGPADTVRLVTNDFMYTGGDGLQCSSRAPMCRIQVTGCLRSRLITSALTRRSRQSSRDVSCLCRKGYPGRRPRQGRF